jgi:hypothetical protein
MTIRPPVHARGASIRRKSPASTSGASPKDRADIQAARERLTPVEERLARALVTIPLELQAEGLSLASLQTSLRGRWRGAGNGSRDRGARRRAKNFTVWANREGDHRLSVMPMIRATASTGISRTRVIAACSNKRVKPLITRSAVVKGFFLAACDPERATPCRVRPGDCCRAKAGNARLDSLLRCKFLVNRTQSHFQCL